MPSGVNDYENSDKITDTSKNDNVSKSFALFQNYPNPFNPGTWIPFELTEGNHVFIRIYSIHGQLVRTLDLGMKTTGNYVNKKDAAYWDGKDDDGLDVSSGVFFCVLESGDFKMVKKMVMIK